MRSCAAFIQFASGFQIFRCCQQALPISATEFAPDMPFPTDMFGRLEDSPQVRLMILLVFRVNCIQFTQGTRGCEERRMKECCKAFKGTRECRGRNVEVVIGIRCGRISIRSPVIFGEILTVCLSNQPKQEKGMGHL